MLKFSKRKIYLQFRNVVYLDNKVLFFLFNRPIFISHINQHNYVILYYRLLPHQLKILVFLIALFNI